MAPDGVREAKFGARLAHTEKHIRDKTVEHLTNFLSKQNDMPEVEMLKIWKGLFYCMWMSDKVPIQNELADTLAKLIHSCNDKVAIQYFCGFTTTMEREWHGIDRLRMDKFYTLVRCVISELFSYLKQRKWSTDVMNTVVTAINEGPFRATESRVDKPPLGFVCHIVDLYWGELCALTGNVLPRKAYGLAEPLVKLCAHTWDPKVPERVNENFLKHLLAVEEVDDTELPLFALNNEPLVAALATQLGELAKAQATRAHNRDAMYERWREFKKMIAMLQGGQELAESGMLFGDDKADAATVDEAVEEEDESVPVRPSRTAKGKRRTGAAAKRKSESTAWSEDAPQKPRKSVCL